MAIAVPPRFEFMFFALAGPDDDGFVTAAAEAGLALLVGLVLTLVYGLKVHSSM